MGLFSSSSKIDQTQTVDNPTLKDYTKTFRDQAPWLFATLDPAAAVASGNMPAGYEAQLKYLSAEEQAQHNIADAAIKRINQRQKSGQFLTPKETDFINQSLDKAYQYAHDVGFKDWTLGAQQLAGSRGLRTSDTPVAAPAMAELRNFELGLGSERAKLGLAATMQMSAQQNAFDEGIREFSLGLLNSKWQTRQGFMFGGGMQGAGNVNYTTHTTGTQTKNPSLMSSIGQTLSVAQQGLNLFSSFKSGTPGNTSTGAWGS